ncbi:pyridoxamine 5'-phosphate oxidase family protein [Aquihabitans daechungensis]|uniref:pyridoxamine 5'-phosphate oxidase family protein n=1 Tax=Aquihabitans daechungensis TaxID=1052257 RepID=UPI003BA154B8
MTANQPEPELHEGFSEPGASAVPWADVVDVLRESEIFWLSTVRSDGRPHVTPIPTVWHQDRLHFCTGDQEQKSKNLLRDPRCVLTTGSSALHGGIDVVTEGTAVRRTGHAELAELAALWKTKLDWDFTVSEEAFGDADGRTALVFALEPAKVLAFNKGPYSQTRFRFAG